MKKYRFKKIYIEITNICNLSCSFCNKNTRPPKFMTSTEFSKILFKIKNLTQHIYLHVLGEPLLHPNLDEILSLAKENNFYVHITTNGTLLKDRLELLKKYPPAWINISLHSTPYSQDIQHLHWVNTVLECAETLAEKSICTTLRLWQFSEINTLSKLDKLSAELLQQKFNIDLSTPTVGKATKISERIFLSTENKFEWPKISENYNTFGRCLGGVDMLAILADGSVTPCCMDSKGVIVFGNIFLQSIDEILNSPRYTNFYSGMKTCKLTEALCQSCTYRLRFNK